MLGSGTASVLTCVFPHLNDASVLVCEEREMCVGVVALVFAILLTSCLQTEPHSHLAVSVSGGECGCSCVEGQVPCQG